jgi:biopolymer transport protein ExbD
MAGGAMRRRGMITEINVTPLVDIMLVLLIIFMLTAHLIARQAFVMGEAQ